MIIQHTIFRLELWMRVDGLPRLPNIEIGQAVQNVLGFDSQRAGCVCWHGVNFGIE